MSQSLNAVVSPPHNFAVNNGIELIKLMAQVGSKLIVAHIFNTF